MNEDCALEPALRVQELGAPVLSARELSRFDLAIDSAQTMQRVAASMAERWPARRN